MSAIQKELQQSCFDEELGFRLKMLRQIKCVSQEELAEYLGTSYQQVQRYEAGKSKMPPERLILCSNLLRVPVEQILIGTENDERYAEFDKKTINIASAIASLPNPEVAQHIYKLAMSIGSDKNI
jgi:transcriptional regulator with XRE-family HTH domain